MECIANALDILQGDKSMYLGYLLPTIREVQKRLQQFKESNRYVYCSPLVDALSSGIQKRYYFAIYLFSVENLRFIVSRFGSIMWKRELVIASCTHPRFKLHWLPEEWCQKAKKWVLEEVEKFEEEVSKSISPIQTDNNQSFFTFESETKQTSRVQLDAETFFSSAGNDFRVLNDYSSIKKVFIKFNTTLPSSASVERLFSIAGEVFKKRRYGLKDDNFEMQLLLKCNKNYV